MFMPLKDDELNIEHEEMAFEAVTHWMEHNLESRKQHLAKLLSAVRLPLVSPYYLHDVVERNTIVNDTPACRLLVDEAKAYHMMPDRRTELHTVRCRPRRCAGEMIIMGVICWSDKDLSGPAQRLMFSPKSGANVSKNSKLEIIPFPIHAGMAITYVMAL